MTNAERIARAAIADTLAICTQAGDARRADDYAGCFTDTATLDLGEPILGREAIRAWLTAPSVIPPPEAGAQGGFVSHHLTTCRITFTADDVAGVRTYWLVVTARGLDHSGYYQDRFECVGDAWLIAHRRPRTLWKAPRSLVGGAD